MTLSTLIGKSWKTHPEFFPKFQFSDIDRFLENSSSIFSKFQFPGHELDRFLENSSINFCKISGHELERMNFPEIGLCHAPDFFEIILYYFRLNGLFWMSFPEIGPCHALKL